MYNVIFSQSAKRDLDEIIEFYIFNNEKYALKVLNSIKNKVLSLSEFPKKGRVVPELLEFNIRTYRELIEGNWRIIYQISGDIVEIITIIDARRNVADLLVEKLKRKIY